MSAFTETVLVKKLADLNSSQQSIQTLSLWLIHHRKHHAIVAKTWLKELQLVPEKQKLVFMYLANDIIQNSKKKGPEFGKEFGTLLAKAFKHIGESCREPKTKNNLDRILSIWEERGVYDNATIKEYYSALHCDQKVVEKKRKIDTKPTTAPDASAIAAHSNGVSSSKKVKTSSSMTVNNSLSRSMTKEVEKSVKTETVEVNGTVETRTVTLSPHQSFGDPPEPEELIKMIQDLENSASSDAVVREQIANLPPVVSEISLLTKIEDKEAAAKLATKVNDALTLLNDYNARLATEMDDRKKLNTMLKDFQQEQVELLKQAEQRLAEYAGKLTKIKEVQKEIKNHLQNLPDLTQLPSMVEMAPLPSAGELFFNK